MTLNIFPSALPRFAAMAVIAGLANAWPQAQAALPTARSIVDRHVQAIGGLAAHNSVRFVHARGRLTIEAQGIAGDFEAFSARPNKMLTRVSIAGLGLLESGYDGKIGWTLSPLAGPALLEGDELTEAAEDAWFDSALHAADYVKEMATQARADFDGRAAYRLRVVFLGGHEHVEFFDVETGLLRGWEAQRKTPNGVVPVTHILRDYRAFGPLLMAATQIERALGMETMTTVSSCEFAALDDKVFAPPAVIRALIKW
jgi:hypothetical protein